MTEMSSSNATQLGKSRIQKAWKQLTRGFWTVASACALHVPIVVQVFEAQIMDKIRFFVSRRQKGLERFGKRFWEF